MLAQNVTPSRDDAHCVSGEGIVGRRSLVKVESCHAHVMASAAWWLPELQLEFSVDEERVKHPKRESQVLKSGWRTGTRVRKTHQ